MASSSAASLLLSFISPKTLSFPKASSYRSLPPCGGVIGTKKPISLSAASFSLLPQKSASLFARNVAVSSEYEQDEEETNFSPDLKLFVGNLPFNVDSSELAGLFVQAGNVQMVEVVFRIFFFLSFFLSFINVFWEIRFDSIQWGFGCLGFEGLRDFFVYLFLDLDNWSCARASQLNVFVRMCSWILFNWLNWWLLQVIYDKTTGRSRGFGFVTMSTIEEVKAAEQQFNGYVSFLMHLAQCYHP